MSLAQLVAPLISAPKLNRLDSEILLLRAYKNLTPSTRLYLGIGLLAWGTAGLWLSDRAEEKLGLTPSEKDKAELQNLKPRIHVVDKEQRS